MIYFKNKVDSNVKESHIRFLINNNFVSMSSKLKNNIQKYLDMEDNIEKYLDMDMDLNSLENKKKNCCIF